MTETRHIGRKIREHRENLGWTLEFTAEKCSICKEALDNIELGKTDPHISTILKIAHVLQMNLGELNSCMPCIIVAE